jgi:hypothetical protein
MADDFCGYLKQGNVPHEEIQCLKDYEISAFWETDTFKFIYYLE